MNNRIIQDISDYIFVSDAPEKADVIFVPGASRPEHALRAAELWRAGYAPYVLPSGRYSRTSSESLKNRYSTSPQPVWG